MLGLSGIVTFAHASYGMVEKDQLTLLQGKKIKGKVVDEKNEPLVGATVVKKGTTNGTITDADGQFTLDAENGDILVISFMGYVDKEIKVSTQSNYTIELSERFHEIDEVIIVGYGAMKKQNLTGSVSSVNFNEAMESRPVTNLSSALAGLSPGLAVSQSSSAPGNESVSLRVRGVGTLNDSEPLVLIDGVAGNMQDVSPSDVESVSVLKDASSSAIYGSRAANGVILITTKRGKSQKVTATYNGYVGWQSAANMIDFISDYPTHMELLNEAKTNSNQPILYDPKLIDEWRGKSNSDPLNYPNTDWFREIMQTSVITEHNLSVSGGGEKTNFMLSLGYLDNQGVVDNSGYKKYSFRLNIDSKVKSWLNIGGNVYGFWSNRGPINTTELFGNMLMTNPGILPKSADGRYGGSMMSGENTRAYNPRAFVDNSKGDNERQYVGAKFFAKVNFLKHFEFETSFAGSYDNNRSWQYFGPVSIWDFRTDAILYETLSRNSITNTSNRYYSTTLNNLLRFNYSINKEHNMSALLGFDQEYSRRDRFSAGKYDLLSDVIFVIDAAAADATSSGTATDYALRSYFGRINYDYKGKYLIEANARYDGSSRFSKDNRWGFFPSFSAGWRLSEEPFFEPLKSVVSNTKFRASWGKLGNNNIGNYEYQSLYGGQNYSFGGNVVQGVAPTVLSNRKIFWEETTIANVGLDLALFGNNLSFSIDAFNKTTNDILVKLPIPLVMGNVGIPSQNVAKVRNKGFEVQMNYFGKVGNDFNYSVGANLSVIDNKVLKYDGDLKTIQGTQVLTEGESIFRYYVREIDHIVQDKAEIDAMIADGYTFSPSIPQPGDFLYKDTNGDKKINDDDRVIKGSSIPKATYGINVSASYKGFDLYVLGQGVSGIDTYWGGDAFNTFDLHWDYIMRESVQNRWTPDNKSTSYPRLTFGLPNNTLNSDYWLQSASYFRIKSLQLGYTIPTKITSKASISRFRVYTSLENYFTFTDYDGFDPENVGVTYPTMKQWVVGFNVTF